MIKMIRRVNLFLDNISNNYIEGQIHLEYHIGNWKEKERKISIIFYEIGMV